MERGGQGTKRGGFIRERILLRSCKFVKFSLALGKESLSEVIAYSEFHWEASAYQSKNDAQWDCAILFPFFSKAPLK